MAEADDFERADVGSEDETDFATIAAAGTVDEAKKKALDQLRKVVPVVREADVDFVVLEAGSRGGFFGRGKAEARVEARLRPAGEAVSAEVVASGDVEVLRDFVQNVVRLMGVDAHVTAGEGGEAMKAEITGDDLGLLIGRHGSTIDALQYLAAIVVNGDRRQRRHVIVDAEGYRERREVALAAMADRTAQQVMREGVPVTLKPMTAAERKVVHLHLKDHPGVETLSEGSEPFRAVVIAPRGSQE